MMRPEPPVLRLRPKYESSVNSPLLSLLSSFLFVIPSSELGATWGKRTISMFYFTLIILPLIPADRTGLMAEGYLNICKEKVESLRFILIFIHLILMVRSALPGRAQRSTFYNVSH